MRSATEPKKSGGEMDGREVYKRRVLGQSPQQKEGVLRELLYRILPSKPVN